MEQINKYTVTSLGTESVNVLSPLDRELVSSYSLDNVVFLPDKYEVNTNFYDLNENLVETVQDSTSYRVLGGAVNESQTVQICVDPVQDSLSRGYRGDVIVEYEVFNNLFSSNRLEDPTSILYVTDISGDRTEIRAKSVYISDKFLKFYANNIYGKLNDRKYFSEIYLNFLDLGNIKEVGVNISTEVVDGIFYVLFKLYKPLPSDVVLKSRFTVLERIGNPTRFRVDREVKVVEDTVPELKGPNFNVDCSNISNGTTRYYNFNELFSLPLSGSYYQGYTNFGEDSAEISIDYEDYGNFIHFSSAAERLENFRYKLCLLKKYSREQLELENINPSDPNLERYNKLIEGILMNFDHYEKFLYFSDSPKAWPKESTSVRPYVNIDPEDPSIEDWWEKALFEAQDYDEHNVDLLINSIPPSIRESVDNEPYVVFVHMVGQHFDNEWIYAKAVSDKYKADNRLNFGVSKDLVKKALSDLGIILYESNQNLDGLFDLCNYDGSYNVGTETSVKTFKRITAASVSIPENYDGEYSDALPPYIKLLNGEYAFWSGAPSTIADGGPSYDEWFGKNIQQPLHLDNYRKEVYKRVYHNVPYLLKTKGTERGLRALISCFGIPEDILTIKVHGGTKTPEPNKSFYGPEESTLSTLDRIRLDNTGSVIPLEIKQISSGSSDITVVTSSVVYLDVPNFTAESHNVPESHQIEVGFNLNEQFNQYVKGNLNNFNFDSIVGDPRNLNKEDYGLNLILAQIMSDIQADGVSFRSPSAIIRLVRYIDSMLMRSIQEFISAHDDVSTGVIVEDHLLHRNRYTGNTIEFIVEGLETSLEITGNNSIEGSSGGCYKNVPVYVNGQEVISIQEVSLTRDPIKVSSICPTVNYTGKVLTLGDSIEKPVFDDSPEYNGELSGSILPVFRQKKEFRKISRTPVYRVNMQFLNLPKPGLTIEPRIEVWPSEIKVGLKGDKGTIVVNSNVEWELLN